MQQREPDEARLQVYNPDPERDGWSSPHTVAEILCDDMPFLVDSVTMELRRQGFAIELVIHPVMRVRRVREGRLQELVAAGEPATGAVAESVMHVEVLRTQAPAELERLRESLHRVLGEVRLAVGDWAAMLERLAAIRDELAAGAPKAAGGAVSEDRVAREELEEVIRFLDWLGRDHFTFLGYREYDLVSEDGQGQLRAREGS